MATKVTSEDFGSQVLAAPVPVLVDFYATWCAPCRLQGPILDDLARESGSRFHVYKVDADQEPELAEEYGVSALPTLIIFHAGKPIERFVGLQTKERLARALSSAV